jgi:hypothetical protein
LTRHTLQRQRDLSALDVQQQIGEGRFSPSPGQTTNSQLLNDVSNNDLNGSVPELVNENVAEIDTAGIKPYEDESLWQM